MIEVVVSDKKREKAQSIWESIGGFGQYQKVKKKKLCKKVIFFWVTLEKQGTQKNKTDHISVCEISSRDAWESVPGRASALFH